MGLWENRLPTDRLQNEKWQQFLEVIEETWFEYLEPELARFHQIFTFEANATDRKLRMSEWGSKFLATASHIAPELAIQQIRQLNLLKNTETLWSSYGRQLGFEEGDIQLDSVRVNTGNQYENKFIPENGDIQTSRVQLRLSIENAIWLTQPVDSPANLMQTYAEQTRPAHIVLEPAILETAQEKLTMHITGYGGVEMEGETCRILL